MSMLKPWGLLLVTAMVAASGCDELPLLAVNVCGNRVVEPDNGEDCDGLSAEQLAAGLMCRGPAEEHHSCRWDCRASACPPGFGCGADGICRRPSGVFEAIHSEATAPTTGYLIADLNGAGCGELVRTSRGGYGILSLPSPAGEAYEGYTCSAYSQAIPFPPQMASTALPVAGSLGDDGSEGNETGGSGGSDGTAPAADQRTALIIPAAGNAGDGLFTFFAGSEPELMPLLYLNIPLPSSKVRAVAVGLGDGSAGFVLLSGPAPGDSPAPRDGPPGNEKTQCDKPPERPWLYGATKPQNGIEPLGPLDGPLDSPLDPELSPDDIVALTAADLDGDGCEEVLFALAGTSEVHILSPCDEGVPDSLVSCRSDLSDRFAQPVRLPAGAAFSQPTPDGRVTLRVIDHNGDGYPDLLIAPGSVTTDPQHPEIPVHIAYGLGDRQLHSTLSQLPAVMAGNILPDQLASPLGPPAVAAPVVVSPGNIFVAGRFAEDPSQPPEIHQVVCPPNPTFVAAACGNVPAECSAVAVDLDGDGHLDIVSAEPNLADLDYAKGDGTGAFSHFTIPTTCPPTSLVTGDFDGDQLADVAYFDQLLDEDDVTSWLTLSVLYGYPSPHGLEVESFGRFPVEQAMVRDLAAGRMPVWHPPEDPDGEWDKHIAAIDTLAVIAPSFEAAGAAQAGSGTALGLVEGQTARLLYAPYYFPGEPPKLLATLKIAGLARGAFTAPGSGSLAVLTAEGKAQDAVELWLLEAANEANSLTLSGLQLSLAEPDLCYEPNPTGDSNDNTPLRCMMAALNASHEADADGDGDLADDQIDELVIFGLNGQVAVYRAGSAGAGFGPALQVQATSYRFVAYDNGNPIGHNRPPAVADLDGDGYQDVVLPSQQGTDYTLISLWGDGQGGFEVVPLTRAPAEQQLTYPHQPGYALLNVDLDAAPELAVIEQGEVILYDFDPSSRGRLSERSRFRPPHLPPDMEHSFASAAAGDVDGDGVDDLVVAGSVAEHVVLRGKPERD